MYTGITNMTSSDIKFDAFMNDHKVHKLILVISLFVGLVFIISITATIILCIRSRNKRIKKEREFICRAAQTDPNPDFPPLILKPKKEIITKKSSQPPQTLQNHLSKTSNQLSLTPSLIIPSIKVPTPSLIREHQPSLQECLKLLNDLTKKYEKFEINDCNFYSSNYLPSLPESLKTNNLTSIYIDIDKGKKRIE
ncbi:1645_t:CDS:1 [Diversispora eburnea]|uniref:1645_t:CDS:1 n=1 Tax=Diversispora eburnea TaxID=1213867 RepID=A0A9N8VQ96_9GLOM|nr:1645_t:CDS:1 [Diversispora eburnea]